MAKEAIFVRTSADEGRCDLLNVVTNADHIGISLVTGFVILMKWENFLSITIKFDEV